MSQHDTTKSQIAAWEVAGYRANGCDPFKRDGLWFRCSDEGRPGHVCQCAETLAEARRPAAPERGDIADPNSGRSQNANYWRQVNAPSAAPVAGAQPEAGHIEKHDCIEMAFRAASKRYQWGCTCSAKGTASTVDDAEYAYLAHVRDALRATVTAQAEEIARLKQKMGTLYEALDPVDGVEAQYVGCYILKWGKTAEPTIMFRRYEAPHAS